MPKKINIREVIDVVALQREYAEITKQIRSLIKRKKVIQSFLKKAGEMPIRADYYDKPISLYVLQLEDSCWYIGSSRNVDRRFKSHSKGKGAAWTKRHKPIAIHKVIETGSINDSDVGLMEDALTLEFAQAYGTQYVRGGGYCQTKPLWPQEVLINE